MSKYLTLKEAKNQLEELPSQLNDEPIIITKEGKPVMTAISYEQYESIMETLSILRDQTFANKLQQSILQMQQDQTINWEDAKAKLGI